MRLRTQLRIATLAVGALALAAPLLLRSSTPPVLLNLTTSLPGTVYVHVDREPRAGDVVAVCLPQELARFAVERGYVARGRRCPGGSSPLLKHVAALAGAEVRYVGERVVVDDVTLEASAIRQRDSQDRAMPVFRLPDYIVGEGEVLLVNAHPLSFDSRYFGPVPIASLLGVYRPMLGGNLPPGVARGSSEAAPHSPGDESPGYRPSVATRRMHERHRLAIPSGAQRPKDGSQGFQPLAWRLPAP